MIARGLSSLVVAVAVLAIAEPASAAYSAAVKGACKRDYKRFCAAFDVSDPGLRRCMDRAGQSLSKTCVKALVNGGHVTKQRATNRWKQRLD